MPRPRGIGMPRPKKEKSLPAADDSQPSMMDAGIDADPSEGSAARPSLVEEAPSRKSPGAPTTTCCCCSVRARHS